MTADTITIDVTPTTTPVLELLVERGSTRAALAAALPHVPSDPEADFSRVRFSFTSYRNDPYTQLLVSACDGYTGVVARAFVHDVVTLPALSVVDLPLQSVRDVLAVFKPPSGKDDRAQWETESFRISVTDMDITWQEAGALLDGRSLTVPRMAPAPESEKENYPDLPGILSTRLTSPPGAGEATYNPVYLQRLTASAKAQGEGRVRLSTHADSLMATWTAGPHCAGLIGGIRINDDELLVHDRITADWHDDLAPLARSGGERL